MTEPNAQQTLVERLRALLDPQQRVREVPMFGGISFLVEDRIAVAARRDGGLLVRINPAAYDELRARGGEPAVMGAGRSMGRGWLTVAAPVIARDDELGYWVAVGIAASAR